MDFFLNRKASRASSKLFRSEVFVCNNLARFAKLAYCHQICSVVDHPDCFGLLNCGTCLGKKRLFAWKFCANCLTRSAEVIAFRKKERERLEILFPSSQCLISIALRVQGFGGHSQDVCEKGSGAEEDCHQGERERQKGTKQRVGVGWVGVCVCVCVGGVRECTILRMFHTNS